jgi:DNA-binding NarL/FixJ family response regulator
MIGHITLIIAHNHLIFRAILHHILQSYAGICILARVDSAVELLKKTKELAPDVVLVELGLPGMADVAAWQQFVAHCGNAKVVVSWHHSDADKIPGMMRASCAGYIARDASPAEYVYAVKQVAKGKEFYCTQTQKLRGSTNEIANFAKSLDDKWLRMLYCICIGYSNKETSAATGLKENTVKSYRKKLKSITGFRSVAALEQMLKGIGDEK